MRAAPGAVKSRLPRSTDRTSTSVRIAVGGPASADRASVAQMSTPLPRATAAGSAVDTSTDTTRPGRSDCATSADSGTSSPSPTTPRTVVPACTADSAGMYAGAEAGSFTSTATSSSVVTSLPGTSATAAAHTRVVSATARTRVVVATSDASTSTAPMSSRGSRHRGRVRRRARGTAVVVSRSFMCVLPISTCPDAQRRHLIEFDCHRCHSML